MGIDRCRCVYDIRAADWVYQSSQNSPELGSRPYVNIKITTDVEFDLDNTKNYDKYVNKQKSINNITLRRVIEKK